MNELMNYMTDANSFHFSGAYSMQAGLVNRDLIRKAFFFSFILEKSSQGSEK